MEGAAGSLLKTSADNQDETDSPAVRVNEPTGNANCRKKDLKVVQLNDSVFKEVCVQLEIYPELHDKNWKGLAGKLGYSATQVKEFELTKHPADSLLSYWSTERDNNVMYLIRVLGEMGRQDLVKLLQDEIDCNCDECGSLR